jgi:hypothetical protein
VPSAPKPQIIAHCLACAAPLAGPFCQNCGQPSAAARVVGINPFGFSPIQIVVVVVGLAYATLTQRRIYAESWTIAALKSVVVVAAGAVVHNLMLIMALVIALLVT